METYEEFLIAKRQSNSENGFKPISLPKFLYDFQRVLVEWTIRGGRTASFGDCGTGKTGMQLVWADNVVRYTNKPVLILTPLAVASQTLGEAQKFSIDAEHSRDGNFKGKRIVIANYERLHYFNSSDFGGVVCDESSCLKNFAGKRRKLITEFLRTQKYRLLCTATAAPNDYTELGTSSEALGYLGYLDMLNRFFRNDQNTSDVRGHWRGFAAPRVFTSNGWRFKGHAEEAYWQWVCTWARAYRKPSDVGNFSNDKFELPALIINEYVTRNSKPPPGRLIATPATNMREERAERKRTIQERCERAASLVDHKRPAVVWCHLNKEGDLLEKLIPDGTQIAGATPDERKEELYEAFAKGKLRCLIIKPKIGAWGLNWQHCSDIVTFVSHSWEQYYQSVRRCWRFGQKRDVTVSLVTTEGEQGVKKNLQRKAAAADRMFTKLVTHMNDAYVLTEQKCLEAVKAPDWL
jgi:SNF2 family DNA or RNA helicase